MIASGPGSTELGPLSFAGTRQYASVMSSVVNPRTARRRMLALASLAELNAELDRLEAAHRAGKLTRTGNHEPGPIFAHLAMATRCSFDGFPTRVGLPLRILGRLFKSRVLAHPFKPGLKLSSKNESLAWDTSVTFDDGLARLRQQMSRLTAAQSTGPKPSMPHPFFGPMSPDDWRVYHLRHAELHLSFLQPER